MKSTNSILFLIRSITFMMLFALTLTANAVPARRGQWRLLTLTDGTHVRAQLCGDEHAHWWQADDGTRYVENAEAGNYKAVQQIVQSKRRPTFSSAKGRNALSPKRASSVGNSLFKGEKRGLIILVEFPDMRFSKDSPQQLYSRIANEHGFSEDAFNGSVRDYFIAQSGGQFTLDFDVVGPVMMRHGYSYYGGNDDNGSDQNAEAMIQEACRGVNDSVDFSRYDWDGDGVVEEVFVLYAGQGEADGGSANTIWPHMYNLSYTYSNLRLDGVTIDTYACASELNGDNQLDGIGTFCHEFSHCMGFPDVYDTNNSGNYGMGSWDLMDYGSYNGNGYTPAGYTGYEKMICGWTTPVELTADTTVSNVSALNDMGQTYIIYNQGNRNECYIIENRQRSGYDSYLPGHGLLIEHIDYDADIWFYNAVNTTTGDAAYGNDHQRMTMFHADNDDDSKYWMGRYYYRTTEEGDLYPYSGNDSLTCFSTPACAVYNDNVDGTKYMNCAIRDISENRDGTVNFSFALQSTIGNDPYSDLDSDTLFCETFDKCNLAGGNDGAFSRLSSFVEGFNPDNDGWTGNYPHGGSECAWFGTSSFTGIATTPSIILRGDTAVLSFRAAAWNAARDYTDLQVTSSNKSIRLIDGGIIEMTKGAFNSFSLRLVGAGGTKLTFTGNKRFFLDDVVIVRQHSVSNTTAIKGLSANKKAGNARIFNLSGQYLGTNLQSLPKGIYIVGGRKVVR